MDDPQRLWETLTHVNAWIRFADAKAGGLLTLGGAFGGALLMWLGDPSSAARGATTISIVLLAVSVVAALGVAVNALLCLAPLTDPVDSEYQTTIFFGHIAQHDSWRSFFQSMRQEDTDRLLQDLSHQVYENSRIATYKFRKIARASQFTAAMILLSGMGWAIEVGKSVSQAFGT